MQSKGMDWITVKGNHIPIFKGESEKDAVQRFFDLKQNEKQKNNQMANAKAEADKRNAQEPPKRLRLKDIPAKDANKFSDVLHLKTKQRYRFKDGTSITGAYVFAGKGCSKVFRDAEKYAKRYPESGKNPEDWQHCAGFATITNGSKVLNREVHRVQGKDGYVREAFIKIHEKQLSYGK